MPLYDYKCPECDETLLDQRLPMEHVTPACPVCRSEMIQMLQPTPVQFLGLGWTAHAGTEDRKDR